MKTTKQKFIVVEEKRLNKDFNHKFMDHKDENVEKVWH